MKQFTEIENAINQQQPVKITESLSLAWQAFKRQPGQYIGFLLVVVLASIVLSMIPFASTLLSPFIVLGFAAYLFEEIGSKNVSFNNFFKPFHKFVNILLTYLLTLAAYIVACLPILIFGGMELFKQVMDAQTNPYNFHPVFSSTLVITGVISFILCMIVAVLLSFSTYFAYFYTVTPMEAIKLSIQMGSKNFGHIIMLLIFSGVIAASGVIAIVIGLLVTVPLAYLMMYFTFAGITQLETHNDPEFDFEKQ